MPLTTTATIRQTSAGGSRQIDAVASTQDTPAGQAVTITVNQGALGGLPPGRATYIAVRLYRNVDSGTKTLVKQFEINVPASTVEIPDSSFPQAFTFYLTDTGESGGSPRSGVLELAIYGKRLDTFSAVVWEQESDGSPNTPQTGFTSVLQRAAIRGTTTATLTPSLTAWAYPETPTLTADLAAPSYENRTLTLVAGPSSGASNSTTDNHVRTVTVNNTFPAASTVYTPSITVPNSTFADMAWTTLTTTATDVTVDPRITFDQHGQKNSNTYATPPVDSGTSRLTTDLWFLSTRALNSKGVGISTLAWTSKLWDAGGLVGTEGSPVVTRNSTASTQGGQVGWADGFVTWDESLPSGTWYFKHVITTSGATGLESNGTHTFTLLARNLDYVIVPGGGPASGPKGHMADGSTYRVGASLINSSTGNRVPVTTASVALFRLADSQLGASQGYGQWWDGTDWQNLDDDADVVTFFALAQTRPGSNVFYKDFDTTVAGWGDFALDVFPLIRLVDSTGTPYVGSAQTPFLGMTNEHTGYAVDPLALALSGSLSMR